MAGMTNYTEVQVLNAALRNIAFQVANQFVALHIGDPGEDGSLNELTDSGYVRKAGTFGAPVSGAGTCANSAEVEFNAIADASTFTITHFSVWDAASGGNCILKGSVALAKDYSQTDIPRFPVGSLIVTAA